MTPSKRLLKKLRNDNIDGFLQLKIHSMIEDETWKEEIFDSMDDEFMYSNFYGYTKEEIKGYINRRYDTESKFIFRLNKFLNKEEVKMLSRKFMTKEELEWYESIANNF